MSTIKGLDIANKFVELHVNLSRWNKTQWQKACVTSLMEGCRKESITMRQCQMLMLIRQGLDTVSALSGHLGLSKSSTSLTVSKMVDNGFLRKEQAGEEDDRRKTYFYLTEKGLTYAKSMETMIVQTLGGYFDGMETPLRSSIFAHLDQINQLLLGGMKE